MRLPLTIKPSWRCLNLPARFCGRLYRVDILTLASLMTFRFNVRECPAIVAYTCNCPRALFSRLYETLAYCADDAEMSFVCAHTSNFVCRLPFGLRCPEILQSHDYAADLTAKDHALWPALKIAPKSFLIAERQMIRQHGIDDSYKKNHEYQRTR